MSPFHRDVANLAAQARARFAIPSSTVTIYPLTVGGPGPEVDEFYDGNNASTAEARWESATTTERTEAAQVGKQLDLVLVFDNTLTPVPAYSVILYEGTHYRVLGSTPNPQLHEVRVLLTRIDQNTITVVSSP